MAGARIRTLIAAIAVAAVLSYGLLGHGVSPAGRHDGMAGAAAGICLLIATVLVYAGVPRPQAPRAAVVGSPARWSASPAPRPAPDGRARASPTVLRRFRN